MQILCSRQPLRLHDLFELPPIELAEKSPGLLLAPSYQRCFDMTFERIECNIVQKFVRSGRRWRQFGP